MYTSNYYCHYLGQVGEKMISCSKKSTGHYACDEHSYVIRDASDALELYEFVKAHVTAKVKIYLAEAEAAQGKPAKSLISKKIYDFLFEYPIFLTRHEKFAVTSYNKLLEFKEEHIDDYFNIPEYIDKFKQLSGITDDHPGVHVLTITTDEQTIPSKLTSMPQKSKKNVSNKSNKSAKTDKIIKIETEKPTDQAINKIDNVKLKKGRKSTNLVCDNFEEMVIDL